MDGCVAGCVVGCVVGWMDGWVFGQAGGRTDASTHLPTEGGDTFNTAVMLLVRQYLLSLPPKSKHASLHMSSYLIQAWKT